ncbi:methylenetetrahydrofolate reductase [Nesterenkonia sp. F]|uniref:methylenetetrahydrofolate reductase n=1 Tax=Nesterenkonia sp. F TaxID=795955 RepID=UPI000255CE7C|nr:methylenetetrahydrofolate reductase [Nesterenkonia sp. F]
MRRTTAPESGLDRETRRRLGAMLAEARFEVLPLDGVVEEVTDRLPAEVTVTVTSSPAKGPEATVEVAAELSRRGHRVVPHLAAAHLAGEDQLAAVLERLAAAGIEEVFVVGGDSDADGATAGFRDGEQLLEAVARLAPQLRLGVGGYPEGHPVIPDEALRDALRRKSRRAEVVVSQMCLDAETVRGWAATMREDGISARLVAGLPGVVGTSRLLRVGRRIGVGDSLRFLTSRLRGGQGGGLARLVAPGRWDPAPTATALAAPPIDSEVPLDGLHFYTFNAVAETEHRRRDLLAQLEELERLDDEGGAA